MYKSHNVLKEIWVFLKRHVVICILLIICGLVVTKFSKIPVPRWVPSLIANLLICPSVGTEAYEWWALLNNLSLAFIASIIAYIFIQYIPDRRQAQKAFSILRKEFCSLYLYMSQLAYMYLFETGVDKKECQVSTEDLTGMLYVEISDTFRDCRIRTIRNGKDAKSESHGYNLYRDSKKYADLVCKSIERINSTGCSSQLDIDLVDTVSSIENNQFLQHFSLMQVPYTRTPGYQNVTVNFNSYFHGFVRCHCSLSKYRIDLITYEFSKMDDEEIQSENEKRLFMTTRAALKFLEPSKINKITEGIIALQPTEERLRKSEAVMLEMLVYYDFELQKPKGILETALRIAEYIRKNETDFLKKKYAFLNSMQIKKRLGILSNKDKYRIYCISADIRMPPELLLGALILREKDREAAVVFNALPDKEKRFFTHLPIYHLWENPPIEASPDPLLFNELYAKQRSEHM